MRHSTKRLENGRAASALFLALALMASTATAVQAQVFTSVDFSPFHNVRLQDLQPASAGLPAGMVTLGGVPFNIPSIGNNSWWGQNASPSSINIPVGVFGANHVHTLINTSYGQPGPQSFVSVEFFGTLGGYFRADMIGDVDVRDHFFSGWTNSINNTTTMQVAVSGPGGPFNESRIDKQDITLPGIFASQLLDHIIVTDYGGVGISNVLLQGLTVSSVPEPSSMVMVGLGIAGLARCIRRNNKNATHAP